MKNKSLGVIRGTVKIQEHSKDWSNVYEAEKAILVAIFKNNYLAIEHIGSTAIPNLVAKPLIDIAIQVKNIDELGSIPKQLIANGYVERIGRLSGRQKVFAKGGDLNVTHHLHIIEAGEIDWEEKIRFKNILIAQPKIALEYAELKKSLASQFPNDRSKYTKGKAEFISAQLNK